MKVIKRNGRTEELDISKIKKYTSEAVEGLDNVSLSELEVDAKIQFRDNITTEEILLREYPIGVILLIMSPAFYYKLFAFLISY